MKVHYFYSRKSHYNDNWFAVNLEAIMEEDVTYAGSNLHGKSFLFLEQINLHVHKKMEEFQACRFSIHFGKDSAHGPGHKSVKELYDYKKNDTWCAWRSITRAQYERIRKIAFARYEKEKCMDFDLVSGEQKDIIRVL